MKKCYLHLGLHKTGSSSFQHACGCLKDELMASNILYPRFKFPPDREAEESIWNHSSAINMVYTKPRNNSAPIKAKFKKTLRERNKRVFRSKVLNSNHDILISAEKLSCFSNQQLKALLRDLISHNFDVKAFALVRTPYSFACSALQQTIKQGAFKPLISLNGHRPPSAQNSRFPTTSERIQTLKKAFEDQIYFYPYRLAQKHPHGLVAYIFECMNIKVDINWSTESQAVKNTSMSNLQTRLINEMNQASSDNLQAKARSKMKRRAELKALREATDDLESEPFRLNNEEFSLIKSDLNHEREAITTLLGTSFSEEVVSFSSDKDDKQLIDKGLEICNRIFQSNHS